MIRLLAKALDVAPSRLRIAHGENDRRKLVVVEGDAAALEAKLEPWLKGNA